MSPEIGLPAFVAIGQCLVLFDHNKGSDKTLDYLTASKCIGGRLQVSSL